MTNLIDYLDELRGRQGRREELFGDSEYLPADERGAAECCDGLDIERFDQVEAQEIEDTWPDPLDR